MQFTFEENNLLCKNIEKNNLSRGKIPGRISNGPSLSNRYLKISLHMTVKTLSSSTNMAATWPILAECVRKIFLIISPETILAEGPHGCPQTTMKAVPVQPNNNIIQINFFGSLTGGSALPNMLCSIYSFSHLAFNILS